MWFVRIRLWFVCAPALIPAHAVGAGYNIMSTLGVGLAKVSVRRGGVVQHTPLLGAATYVVRHPTPQITTQGYL
jgi:hypothetical protein